MDFYERKPEKVEAYMLTESNMDSVAAWCHGNKDHDGYGLYVPMLGGSMFVCPGEYIVKNSTGICRRETARHFEKEFNPLYSNRKKA